MNFVGIDLSWSVSSPKYQRTAAVVLSEDCEVIDSTLITTDEDILKFIKSYRTNGCIVGIDAPLVIPPDVKQRECERQLLLSGIAVFPGNRNWFNRAFGGVRGEILVARFKEMEIPLRDKIKPRSRANALFEVYPYASWKVLFKGETVPRFKNTKWENKVRGLQQLRKKLLEIKKPAKLKISRELKNRLEGIQSQSSKDLDRTGDLLDAVMAAYTVLVYWYYGNKECVVLGDLKNVYILTMAHKKLKEMVQKRKS